MISDHPVHPCAITARQVRPGLGFITIDREGKVLRRGKFTSEPRSISIDGLTISYAETEPDSNHGVSHVYFGDAGIAPHPMRDGAWRTDALTIPVNPHHAESMTVLDVARGRDFAVVNRFMGTTYTGFFREAPVLRNGRMVASAVTSPSYTMRHGGVVLAEIGILPYPDGHWNQANHTIAAPAKERHLLPSSPRRFSLEQMVRDNPDYKEWWA